MTVLFVAVGEVFCQRETDLVLLRCDIRRCAGIKVSS